jgi:hypothetical protein
VHGLSDGAHVFQVWAVDAAGRQDPAGVAWTFTVLTAPAAVSSPSLSSSSAQVGQTVTCDSGSWSGQPTISYRWYSNGSPITDPQPSGAYTPQRSDAGQAITCQVLAANAAGQSERSAGDVQIGQFALLGDLSFPTSLQAAHLRSLPTLSFQSSNSGRLQVKLIACRRGCRSRRRHVVATKAFSVDTGLNRLHLPSRWRRKLTAGRYQLALHASTPYGDQQATIALNILSTATLPVPVEVHATNSAYINPLPYVTSSGRWERTDMGVDATMPVGAPIVAPSAVKILGIEPNWFEGQPLVYFELLAGPDAGKVQYVAEQITDVARPGAVLRQGQAIARFARSGTGIEYGWCTPSGATLAVATTGYKEGQITPAGRSIRAWLNSLGAQAGPDT